MYVRTRFWVETSLSAVTCFLTLLTLVWRDWIEALTGLHPDGGNGSLEWGVVAVFAVPSIFFALLARREFRRTRTGPSSPSPLWRV